ncbi:MAG: adenylate/guanylate cyclase domain-containing protein [Bacteroidota bacterium]
MEASKILVVDDETDLELLIRQKFRKKIKAGAYDFVFAVNGYDALGKIEAYPDIDIVLSDINMPNMDGLTLLRKIQETTPLIKTVMVSAYGDMENIRTAMNRGAFDFVVKPVNFADLELTMEKTLDHVRQMKSTLKAIQENNILKMYVDENVINFMAGREFEQSLTANEMIEASVTFVDICHFTAISEKESPDAVVQLLNHYFELMVKEIIIYGGQVDKFMGDSVMAVFRGENHMEKAIRSALAVKKSISNNNKLTDSDLKLEVSIGVNSGEMISGNIGSASLKRLDFTVIGDHVNVAQRLQSNAQPNQILISADLAEKINHQFKCNPVGTVRLKNKKALIEVFEVH